HVGYKEGALDVGISLTEAKTLKFAGGTVEATIDATSTLKYAAGEITGSVKGSAKLGTVADGKFDLAWNGTALNGTIDMKLKKIPGLKDGIEIHLKFENNVVSTTAPIVLEWDDKFKKYIDGDVKLTVVNNKVDIHGKINAINNIGEVGKT